MTVTYVFQVFKYGARNTNSKSYKAGSQSPKSALLSFLKMNHLQVLTPPRSSSVSLHFVVSLAWRTGPKSPPRVFYCIDWSEMDIESLWFLDLFHATR